MRNLRYFYDRDQYDKEKLYLKFPGVSYVKNFSSLKYNFIPKKIKESLIAWYSPARQKLTNYDVVESYGDDFTTYGTEIQSGITITNTKVTISSGTRLGGVVLYKPHRKGTLGYYVLYTGNTTITYKYDKKDGTKGRVELNSNGIYYIPSSEPISDNFGFYATNQLLTEDLIIQMLPTSYLRDISNNDNNVYLYKFQGKLGSGVGVYKTDFSSWRIEGYEYSGTKLIAKSGDNFATLYGTESNEVTIKVEGFTRDKVRYFRIGHYEEGSVKEYEVEKDGVYTIPSSQSQVEAHLSSINLSLQGDTNITITQIPDYPNYLSYDGLCYSFSPKFPKLTDYTVIAERQWYPKTGNRYAAFISKCRLFENLNADNGAFTVDHDDDVNRVDTVSFGKRNLLDKFSEETIIYQTKTSYNGTPITPGDKEDNDILLIGSRIWRDEIGSPQDKWIGGHGDVLIFDRSLSIDEINWVKENLINVDKPMFPPENNESPDPFYEAVNSSDFLKSYF